jgi:hypothetical protein
MDFFKFAKKWKINEAEKFQDYQQALITEFKNHFSSFQISKIKFEFDFYGQPLSAVLSFKDLSEQIFDLKEDFNNNEISLALQKFLQSHEQCDVEISNYLKNNYCLIVSADYACFN